MNIYSFSISSPDFIFNPSSALCQGGFITPSHRWNDPNTPKIRDSECAGAGIWDAHGLVPKVFASRPCCLLRWWAPVPHSQRASCRDARLPCLVVWCLHTLLLLGLGAPLPSLEGVLETVWFIFDMSVPCSGWRSPTQHQASSDCLLKCALPRVGSRESTCSWCQALLVAASCGFILSMFGGASWAAFFWSLF